LVFHLVDNRLAAAERACQGIRTKPENSRVRFEAKLSGGEIRPKAHEPTAGLGWLLFLCLELGFKRGEGRDQYGKKNRRW